jgi:hypothetical protein
VCLEGNHEQPRVLVSLGLHGVAPATDAGIVARVNALHQVCSALDGVRGSYGPCSVLRCGHMEILGCGACLHPEDDGTSNMRWERSEVQSPQIGSREIELEGQ